MKTFSYALIILSFIIVYLVKTSIEIPLINISAQTTALNMDKRFIHTLNLGNRRMLAGLLWLKTLIEADSEHYKKQDANSWMFLRFDTLTSLDPNFYEPYTLGGEYLSVVKDDKIGAQKIFEKGLKVFSDDFWLNFFSANHYYFELYNLERAYQLFYKIQYHPTALNKMPYLPSITAKIKAQQGDLKTAFQLIHASYLRVPEKSKMREKHRQQLYAIKAEIDLNCLNDIKRNCNKYDFNGVPYQIKPNGQFYAKENWQPFRPSNK